MKSNNLILKDSIDLIRKNIMSVFTEKSKKNELCNFSSNLLIYGQKKSGKSSILRGTDCNEGLFVSIFSDFFNYLSKKRKEDLLIMRIGCFCMQNDAITNLTEIPDSRNYV